MSDVLVYLECEVVSWMEVSDYWIIYVIVDNGWVSDLDVLFAVYYRKVGNYY